jgi:hypothetical protein
MKQCAWGLLSMAMACTTPPPPTPDAPDPPTPTVDVAPDWVIVEDERTHLALRWRDTSDGVRIQFAQHGTRLAGVSPIIGGQTYDIDVSGQRVPMFTPAWPEHAITAAVVERKGPDLLIRLQGVPLSELTSNSEVPADPMLTWLRLRHRGDTIRIVARGLFVWRLPAHGLTHSARRLTRVTTTESWGTFSWDDTAAAAWTSSMDDNVWRYDNSASLTIDEPYLRMGVTWQLPPRPLIP